MRILVTGGAGFIGSHLVDAFLAEGHDVLVVDSLVSGRKENVNPKAELVVTDIRSDESAQVITTFAPEVLCHQAAQMDVRKSVTDPVFDADVNLVGLVKTYEAARAGGGLEHVLFAGSGGAMYGEQQAFPAGETHPVAPESPYGLTKACGEQYLALFERMYGVGYTALRYANVYGPRQNPHGEAGVVAIFSQRLLQGQPITIFGDGKQTRDYVFVHDVVKANLLALSHRLVGGFNVGTGRETDVNELAATLIRLTQTEREPDYAPARAGEQARSVITSEKLRLATGFAPETPLERGLDETVAYFRSLLS